MKKKEKSEKQVQPEKEYASGNDSNEDSCGDNDD